MQNAFRQPISLRNLGTTMFYKGALKRAGDITGAVIGLILMSPLLLVLSVLIFAYDRGPIFFKQKRIGLNGKEFWFIKFRSMPVNTPNVTSTETAKLSITPIGKFIRRTNIDEVPQLLNVLKGEMSIIGPRPCIPTQITLIQARQENNAISIRPGLTGS